MNKNIENNIFFIYKKDYECPELIDIFNDEKKAIEYMNILNKFDDEEKYFVITKPVKTEIPKQYIIVYSFFHDFENIVITEKFKISEDEFKKRKKEKDENEFEKIFTLKEIIDNNIDIDNEIEKLHKKISKMYENKKAYLILNEELKLTWEDIFNSNRRYRHYYDKENLNIIDEKLEIEYKNVQIKIM